VNSKSNPVTIYSNIVNIRTTPSEVIMEFGTSFPDTATEQGKEMSGPPQFSPEARVVMAVSVLPSLAEFFTKAAEKHKQELQQASAGANTPSIKKKPDAPAKEG
jgi:hypothetical protein